MTSNAQRTVDSIVSPVLRHRPLNPTVSPLIMGVLNVTPDSFSDGGDYVDKDRAVARADAMIAEGADIIDVGPESTRPGARPVPAGEQIARAVPVIEAIRTRNDQVAISIDTQLASVAEAALSAGADMVNDVSALRNDPSMVDAVAAAGAWVVLMHMRGTPADMQTEGGPRYEDVLRDVTVFLEERRRYAVSHGVDPARIIFDPGIGFGKRTEHNLAIIRHLNQLVTLGQPVMVGASRKSFIGAILGIEDPRRRENGSLACVALAVMAGAAVVRVHEVQPAREVVRLCQAIRNVDG